MTGKTTLILFFVTVILFCGTKSSEILDNICEGFDFGYLSHPDPERCTEYIICLHGEYHLQNCACPGYIFHLPYRYCVKGEYDQNIGNRKLIS